MSCAEFDRRHREIAALGAHAVAEVAALIGGVGVRGQFGRVDREARVVGIGREAHVVEDEEFGLGTEIGDVADARRLQIFLGLAGDAARVAVVAMAGGRLDDVADEHERGGGEEGVQRGGVEIRHQQHVGLVDRLPAGDRGAVEGDAFVQRVGVDDRDVESHVLPLAARVGEAEIDIFNVVVLDLLDDVVCCAHVDEPSSLFPRSFGLSARSRDVEWSIAGAKGVRARPFRSRRCGFGSRLRH